jgi:molybdopterin synthase sulfur carrier subunit
MPTINFFASLRKTVGTKEIIVPGSSLHVVMDTLVETYPELREQVWDGERLRPHIIITINGHNLDPEQVADIPIKPDDKIAIFPPIAGG